MGLKVLIESLSYGAHGIARAGGKVYFVRGAAPGDEVEIEVREDHGSYAFAEITSVRRAGDARREPPCEYLPRCGGCPWQHIAYPAQLEAKAKAVADLLARVGRLPEVSLSPILPSPAELGYRRRLSLRVEGGRVGYFAAASHDLVPVRRCLLAASELDGALELAQEWVGPLATHLKRIELAAAGDGRTLVFAAQAEGAFAGRDARSTASFLSAQPRVRGIALRGRGWRRTWGEPRLRVPLAGGDGVDLAAGAFLQVNAAANDRLVALVLELARGCDVVLDLYAGFGNLTFPLAGQARSVIAIERDAEAVRAGTEHARSHGVANVTFACADAAAGLAEYHRREGRADAVVLDPPRGGAAAVLEPLLRMGPGRIVYVSCNPATLARDLRGLSPRYRVDRVQPIDFFPQTYHVETVAELRLTDP